MSLEAAAAAGSEHGEGRQERKAVRVFKNVSDVTADHHGDNLIALQDAEHFLNITLNRERLFGHCHDCH